MVHDKIRVVAHSAEKTSKLKFLSEFESIFETALDHKSEDQLGTFGEINLHKKNFRLLSL
jgi:hypothetical protein